MSAATYEVDPFQVDELQEHTGESRAGDGAELRRHAVQR
jgi:hypothetical protein